MTTHTSALAGRTTGVLRRNAAASFAGTAWLALLNIATVPLYLSTLGAEAYGLVGFFTTLTGALAVLDFGLGATTSRELARRVAAGTPPREVSSFARTIEVVYWAMGTAVGAAVVAGAPWLATHWVHPTQLFPAEVTAAIRWMGAAAALQWPVIFYAGALIGLERHVRLNAVVIVSQGARFGLALLGARTAGLVGFFEAQAAVLLVQGLALAALVWRVLGHAGAAPRRAHLRESLGFAAGAGGIAFNGFLLTQSDKIILSRLVPLELFGVYSIVTVVAQSLTLITSPLSKAVFPRLTAMVARGDDARVQYTLHSCAQFVTVAVVPAGAALALFAPEVLALWTGSAATAARGAPALRLLMLGSIFLAFQTVPFQLALAHGWTSLNVRLGFILVLIVVPALLLLAPRLGILAGGLTWCMVNVGVTPFYVRRLFGRLLPGATTRWWTEDVLRPALAACAPLAAVRLATPDLLRLGRPGAVTVLCMAGLLSLVAAAAASRVMREAIRPVFVAWVRRGALT